MTAEVNGIIAYLDATGIPHRVTSTQRPARFPGDHSRHIVGLAADFAGTSPFNGTTSHAPLYDIWHAFMSVAGNLHELIYSGAPFYISGGKVRAIAGLSPDLRAAHWNHVHVSVDAGVILRPQEVAVPDVEFDAAGHPNYKVNAAPVALAVTPSGKGYIVMCADGGIITFGDAPYLGRVHTAVS